MLGYARISRDDEAEGRGVDRQTADIERYATHLGHARVEEVIVDNNVSASRYSHKARAGYLRLVDTLEHADGDTTVIFYDVDRLLRQPRDLEHLIDLADTRSHLRFYSVNGELDLRTGDGRFVARILVAKAAKESDDLSRRVRRRFDADRLAGLPANRGRRPFGYSADRMHLVADEAAVVRDWVARLLAGESLNALTRDANARGIPTATGAPAWRHTTIRQLVLNPRIAGLYARGRGPRWQVLGPAAWPAIITPDDYARLTHLMARPSKQPAPRTRWLTGLIRCAACDQTMTANGNGRRVWFECRRKDGGCGRSVTAGRAEDHMRDVLFALDADDRIRTAPTPTEPAVGEDPDVLRAQMDGYAAALGRGELEWHEFVALREPLKSRLDAAVADSQRRRNEQARAHARVDPLADVWGDLSIPQKQAHARLLLDSVLVGASTGGVFDPRRLTPVPAGVDRTPWLETTRSDGTPRP